MCWYALVFPSVGAEMPEKMFLQVRGLPFLPPLCWIRALASPFEMALTCVSWFCLVPSCFAP